MVIKWNSLRIQVKMKSLTPRENHLLTKTQMRSSSSKPRSKRPEERNATKKTPFPLTVVNAGKSRSRGSHTEVSVHSRVVQPLRIRENHVFFGGMGSLAGWKGIGCRWRISEDAFGRFLALERARKTAFAEESGFEAARRGLLYSISRKKRRVRGIRKSFGLLKKDRDLNRKLRNGPYSSCPGSGTESHWKWTFKE